MASCCGFVCMCLALNWPVGSSMVGLKAEPWPCGHDTKQPRPLIVTAVVFQIPSVTWPDAC